MIAAAPAPSSDVPLSLEALGELGRPRGRLSEELTWFFAEGLTVGQPRSNFARMVEGCAARLGQRAERESWHMVVSTHTHAPCSRELDGRTLEDAHRAARVRRPLATLSEGDQAILAVAFGPRTGPELAGLGPLGSLAPHTKAAQVAHRESGSDKPLGEFLVRLCHRCAAGKTVGATRKKRRAEIATPADRTALAAIAREAECMRAIALVAFRQAADRWDALEASRIWARADARTRLLEAGLQVDVGP